MPIFRISYSNYKFEVFEILEEQYILKTIIDHGHGECSVIIDIHSVPRGSLLSAALRLLFWHMHRRSHCCVVGA